MPSTLFDRTPWLGETAAEALATCNRDDGSRHVRRNVILSRMTSWRLGSIISGSGVICNLIVFLSRQERGSPQDWQPDSLGGSVSKVEMAIFTLPVQRHSG